MQKKIKEKIEEIHKTANAYPGYVVIQNIQELRIVYMSPRALKKIKKSWEEIRNMDINEYHELYFNPEDAKEYFPKIQEMLADKDPDVAISFFQQVRTAVNGDWQWYLTSMRVLLHDDSGNPLLTISFAIPIEAENHINNKINRLLEENKFLRDHYEKFYSLGKREREVLRLIAGGKSNPEISIDLHISEMTVETHRKNIKRKLKIKSPFDLQQYARAFDLI